MDPFVMLFHLRQGHELRPASGALDFLARLDARRGIFSVPNCDHSRVPVAQCGAMASCFTYPIPKRAANSPVGGARVVSFTLPLSRGIPADVFGKTRGERGFSPLQLALLVCPKRGACRKWQIGEHDLSSQRWKGLRRFAGLGYCGVRPAQDESALGSVL